MTPVSRRGDFLMWLLDVTRRFAAQLDAKIAQLTSSTVTVVDYREYLVRTHGFEGPLEAALAYTSGLSAICELRARSGHIVHDLLALGLGAQQIAKLPQCFIAPFASTSTAVGWLYVYERARLQHPLLCARIRTRLRGAKDATDYFCGDELTVTKRWNEVASALERFATTGQSRLRIREAACDAFQVAIDWYSDDQLRMAQ